MAAARPIFGILSLILLAGAVLLQFFLILAGTTNTTPINHVYFLETTTNGIPGARNPSRWMLLYICGADGSRNANCGSPVPALPFDPPRNNNFGTEEGIPDAFIGTNRYFYLSRFAFAFFLISLFFGVVALLTGVLALCTRLGAYLSSANAFVALGFQTLFAALMTAWSVLGRNHFRSAGQDASLGRYAYGFTWAAVACYLLSTIFFCIGGSAGKKNRDTTTTRSRGGLFGRKRSTRSRASRGSFIDSERSGGIKDEY